MHSFTSLCTFSRWKPTDQNEEQEHLDMPPRGRGPLPGTCQALLRERQRPHWPGPEDSQLSPLLAFCKVGWCTPSPLISATTCVASEYCSHPYFTYEEIAAQRSSWLVKITQIEKQGSNVGLLASKAGSSVPRESGCIPHTTWMVQEGG